MITKAQALASLRPGSQWVVRGEAIEWYDNEQTQPTDAEIDTEVARLTALEPTRIAEANRRAAYIAEADPLFFKAQRGEVEQQVWLDKVAEIKLRYPKEAQ